MNRKLISLIILISLMVPMFMIIPPAQADWIIDGDKVYYEDIHVYLSAAPHTLTDDGWVEFELETVSYDGEIDVVWGFDTPDCMPHNAQI